MNETFKKDYYTFCGEKWKWGGVKRLVSNRDMRYVYVGRVSTDSKNVLVKMIFIMA